LQRAHVWAAQRQSEVHVGIRMVDLNDLDERSTADSDVCPWRQGATGNGGRRRAVQHARCRLR
jgi:hypothetical protein